jgi:hypothetical protein
MGAIPPSIAMILYSVSAQHSAVQADCGRPQRRAEQARHPCKSTARAGLSGETLSKEQGLGRAEQASCLIIQGVNRRFTGRASRARASSAASLRNHERFIFDIGSSQFSLGFKKGALSRAPVERAGVHRMVFCSIRQKTAETQSARSASRRAQFQLWIFSYTKFVASSKKRLSRVMMDFTNRFARICQRTLWPFSVRKRTYYSPPPMRSRRRSHALVGVFRPN